MGGGGRIRQGGDVQKIIEMYFVTQPVHIWANLYLLVAMALWLGTHFSYKNELRFRQGSQGWLIGVDGQPSFEPK